MNELLCNLSIYPQNKNNVLESKILHVPKHIRIGIGKYGFEKYDVLYNKTSELFHDLDLLRKQIILLYTTNHISHIMETELENQRTILQHIKHSNIVENIVRHYPDNIVVPMTAINEVYITELYDQYRTPMYLLQSPFWMGLFSCIPYFHILRCTLVIEEEEDIKSIFPISNNTYNLTNGAYILFDYNRSLCYLTKTTHRANNNSNTIYMNLYYLVHPQWMPHIITQTYIWGYTHYNNYSRISYNSFFTLYTKLFLLWIYLYKWIVRE